MAYTSKELDAIQKQVDALRVSADASKREFAEILQRWGVSSEEAEAIFQSYPEAERQKAESAVQALLSAGNLPLQDSHAPSPRSAGAGTSASAARVLRAHMGSRI